MLKHRNTDRICCWVLAFTLLITCCYVGAGAAGLIAPDHSMGYEQRLFDPSRVHTLEIVMEDWDGFLSTCTNEEYAACHLVIDGESYRNAAIRAKGNTSLSSVEKYGNDRYSFKIEFDHYQPGSTYHGLDKLSLNNIIQDNTYLKDYFAYTLMRMGGAAAPLCSFVQINVNGEPWGLYLAVEGVEDSFLRRNYGSDTGELYKPDSMSFGAGRGNGRGFDMDEFRQQLETEEGNAAETAAPEASGVPEGMAMPDGMTPPDGMTMPEGMTPPDGMAMPEGMTPPDGMTMPEGMTPPDGMAMPEGMTPPDGMTMPEGVTPPDGMTMPEGMTPPDSTPAADNAAVPAATTQPEPIIQPAATAAGSVSSTSGFTAPGGFAPFDKGGMGSGMGSRGSADVMLQYIDDDPASYVNIFDNAKTDVSEADQQRLIRALKALSQGDTAAVDQEAVLRYLAVHNFLCNDDSYTGSMVHNYYLYEKDGVLSMLPWDYNLAFGGFGMGGGFGASGATGTVNQAIDSPVTGGELSSRPMVAWVFADEETIARYHQVYDRFIADAFESGWFAAEIDRVSALIDPYVQADPTAFCTYEEFRLGVAALREFCLLRAKSVRGQLEGSIPSTSEGQRSTDALVDASGLDLSDMGSMNNTMGGDRGGFGGDRMQGFGGAAPAGGFGGRMQGGKTGRSERGGGPGTGGTAPGGAAGDAASNGAAGATDGRTAAVGSGATGSAADAGTGSPVPDEPAQQPATGGQAAVSGAAVDSDTASAARASRPQVSASPVPGGELLNTESLLLLVGCGLLLAAAIVLVSRYRSNL